VYHDIDVTASCRGREGLRRHDSSKDVADPRRGWSALVIAEPQRAFSGSLSTRARYMLRTPRRLGWKKESAIPKNCTS